MAKWKHIVTPAILFIATLVTASVFGSYGVDPFHDGNIFKPAKDVSEGMMLYRDTFSQYGPLSTLLMATAIKVFGAKLIVVHTLTAFFYSLIAVMLWLITSRSIPPKAAVIPVLAWLGVAGYIDAEFMPWCNIFADFFMLAALYSCQSAYADRRRCVFNLIAAGLLAGLANLSRNPVGILALIAMLLFIFGHRLEFTLERLRRVFGHALCLSAGFVLPMIVFFGWLVANDAVRDWEIQQVKLPAVIAKERFDLSDPVWILTHLFPFGKLELSGESHLYGLLPIICLVMLGLLGRRLFVKRELCIEERNALALTLVALSSWAQYIPFPDSSYHAYWGATPMFSVAAVLFYWAGKVLTNRIGTTKIGPTGSYLMVGVAMLALTGKDIWKTVQSGWRDKLRSSDWVTMSNPLTVRGMKVYRRQAETMRGLDEAIQGYLAKNPGTSIVNVHKDALYVTFTPNAQNFHPLYVDWSIFSHYRGLLTGIDFPAVIYPDYWNALIEYVQRNQPLVIGHSGLSLPGYAVLTTIPGDNSMGTFPLMDIVVLVPRGGRDTE